MELTKKQKEYCKINGWEKKRFLAKQKHKPVLAEKFQQKIIQYDGEEIKWAKN